MQNGSMNYAITYKTCNIIRTNKVLLKISKPNKWKAPFVKCPKSILIRLKCF